MRRVLVAVVLLAIAAFVYWRPMTIVGTATDVYLYAIGMRGKSVQVGGHRIHYYEGGEGPPLLMVHGVASSAADAALLYRGLMRRHRVLAPDLLGYGHSDKPENATYTVRMQSEMVRGFMDAVRVRNADVLGISMGGWVALKLAAEQPERVRRLVLVSSAGLQFETTLNERSFSARNLDELRASLRLQTDNADRIPTFVLRDILRRSQKHSWITIRSMRSMLTTRDDLLDGRLQRVTMPVLLVWGTRDRIVPFTVAKMMQRELPHARLVALEGCGHLAIVECRAQAVPAIDAFLSSSQRASFAPAHTTGGLSSAP
ncbi:MAG TPA: alpha/beta hydrolase [Thermoanaerobaculia bacterium]|nr:alpha/beta hydrolase [Thermoanaerobaculia bacterium]